MEVAISVELVPSWQEHGQCHGSVSYGIGHHFAQFPLQCLTTWKEAKPVADILHLSSTSPLSFSVSPLSTTPSLHS